MPGTSTDFMRDVIAPYRLPGCDVVATSQFGEILFVSDEFAAELGLRCDTVVGRSFLEFVHGDDISQAIELFSARGDPDGRARGREIRVTNGVEQLVVDVVADNRLTDPVVEAVLLHLADPQDGHPSVPQPDQPAP